MAPVDPADTHAPAPAWRRNLAGLIDGIALSALMRTGRRLAPRESPAEERVQTALFALLGHSALLERVGSPGERALGVRTVDRRTGRPVQLWRAMLLSLASAGMRSLRPRLMPRSRGEEWQLQQEELRREEAELRERYGTDEEAFHTAMRELRERRPPPPVAPDAARIVLVHFGLALAARQLQRRLAPTVVVRRRPRGDHSP